MTRDMLKLEIEKQVDFCPTKKELYNEITDLVMNYHTDLFSDFEQCVNCVSDSGIDTWWDIGNMGTKELIELLPEKEDDLYWVEDAEHLYNITRKDLDDMIMDFLNNQLDKSLDLIYGREEKEKQEEEKKQLETLEEQQMKCPLCEEHSMKYINHNGTFIWSCEHCPAILIEYWGKEDSHGLLNYLGDDKQDD